MFKILFAASYDHIIICPLVMEDRKGLQPQQFSSRAIFSIGFDHLISFE